MSDAARSPGALAVSDGELMAQVKDGSEDAFGELDDRYCDRAYRVARLVCRESGRAEEAVQEAFVSVWRSRASYLHERGPVGAWILTVVRHRAIDIARANTARSARLVSQDKLEHWPAADPDPLEVVHAQTEAKRLYALLGLLPEAQRAVIVLAYYGGLTHTEIAARLALPNGTVKGRMRLGLENSAHTSKRQPHHHR